MVPVPKTRLCGNTHGVAALVGRKAPQQFEASDSTKVGVKYFHRGNELSQVGVVVTSVRDLQVRVAAHRQASCGV